MSTVSARHSRISDRPIYRSAPNPLPAGGVSAIVASARIASLNLMPCGLVDDGDLFALGTALECCATRVRHLQFGEAGDMVGDDQQPPSLWGSAAAARMLRSLAANKTLRTLCWCVAALSARERTLLLCLHPAR